jgi:hypothetical protein
MWFFHSLPADPHYTHFPYRQFGVNGFAVRPSVCGHLPVKSVIIPLSTLTMRLIIILLQIGIVATADCTGVMTHRQSFATFCSPSKKTPHEQEIETESGPLLHSSPSRLFIRFGRKFSVLNSPGCAAQRVERVWREPVLFAGDNRLHPQLSELPSKGDK